MPYIRLYKFSPNSQPPIHVSQMYDWLNHEITHSSIEANKAVEIIDNNPVESNQSENDFIIKVLNGIKILTKALRYLKSNS